MGRPHVGPMLAFRCADRGLIALRSTSQNVHLDEGKIIMALASTAALMLMKKRKGWLFWYSNQMEELGGALSATGCRRCCVLLCFPCDTSRPIKVSCLSCRRKSGICLCRVVTVRTQNCHPNHVWSRCWVQGFYFLPLKCPPGPPPLPTPHSLNCHKGQLHNIKYHKNPTVVVSALEHLGEIDHECRLDKLSAHPDPQMTHTTTRARTYTPESKRKLKGTHTRGEE